MEGLPGDPKVLGGSRGIPFAHRFVENNPLQPSLGLRGDLGRQTSEIIVLGGSKRFSREVITVS